MKVYIVLLSIAAACQAVSFFELVVDEWETFKVNEFYCHFFLSGLAMVCNSQTLATSENVTEVVRYVVLTIT
jgi:hypothetical protein